MRNYSVIAERVLAKLHCLAKENGSDVSSGTHFLAEETGLSEGQVTESLLLLERDGLAARDENSRWVITLDGALEVGRWTSSS